MTVHQRGWVLAAQGQSAEGIAQMREGLSALQATEAELAQPRLLALLAEAYAHGGHAEAGLRVVAEALAVAQRTGERRDEAEISRIKGELLVRQAIPNAPEAEACFQHALAIARRQQAKSWELRAAMGLARLWQQQGKRQEARHCWRKSTAGSPKGLTLLTSRMPGHCSTHSYEFERFPRSSMLIPPVLLRPLIARGGPIQLIDGEC